MLNELKANVKNIGGDEKSIVISGYELGRGPYIRFSSGRVYRHGKHTNVVIKTKIAYEPNQNKQENKPVEQSNTTQQTNSMENQNNAENKQEASKDNNINKENNENLKQENYASEESNKQ